MTWKPIKTPTIARVCGGVCYIVAQWKVAQWLKENTHSCSVKNNDLDHNEEEKHVREARTM